MASLVIRHSAHWLWRVHTNQAHLGHMVFIARRETEGSLADCSPQEWTDLRAQIALFEQVTGALFSPDRFNYTQFGNEWAQLHVHGFPRYREGATWQGRRFPDPQWGKALEEFAEWFAERLEDMAS